MTTQQQPGTKESWKDLILKVAEGNGFDSTDLFYCKFGAYSSIRTEEEYQRALKFIQVHPGDFRILRYEHEDWEPCIYNTFRGNGVIASEYIRTGDEKFLRPNEETI